VIQKRLPPTNGWEVDCTCWCCRKRMGKRGATMKRVAKRSMRRRERHYYNRAET